MFDIGWGYALTCMFEEFELMRWFRQTPTAIAALALLITAAGGDEHDDLPSSHSIKPELVATGFEFAEGPALDPDGNLYVVNYRGNGNVGRITPDGTASVLCVLDKLVPVEGRRARANGLKIDRSGRLIAADSGAGRLLRIASDGSRADVLADRWEGKRFNSINDVALDREGNIYFTDPGASSADSPIGSVYRYDVNTSRVTRLDTGLAFPNGLGVTPDQEYLCVAESQQYRLLRYDLTPEGTVANRQVLITFPDQTVGTIKGGRFDPDGLVFDTRGRLYVAMWTAGVINVVDVPSGRLIRQFDAGGSKATNCHFHGGYLYTTVASKEAVFRLRLGAAGFDYNRPRSNR